MLDGESASSKPGSKLEELRSPGGHNDDEGERSAALKLVLLFREGSGSSVGIPVAEVVVVQVDVDILRNRDGGKCRRSFGIAEGFSPVYGRSSSCESHVGLSSTVIDPP